jgi:hypothetical protein
MNSDNIEIQAYKDFEKASIKYKKDGDIWSIQIIRRMVEDTNLYIDDTISYFKEYLNKQDLFYNQH